MTFNFKTLGSDLRGRNDNCANSSNKSVIIDSIVKGLNPGDISKVG